MDNLPSDARGVHDWRTREDPFQEVWAEVHEQLEASAELQAKTLFQWLQRKYPGQSTRQRTRSRPSLDGLVRLRKFAPLLEFLRQADVVRRNAVERGATSGARFGQFVVQRDLAVAAAQVS
jgi:hypothetical protein